MYATQVSRGNGLGGLLLSQSYVLAVLVERGRGRPPPNLVCWRNPDHMSRRHSDSTSGVFGVSETHSFSVISVVGSWDGGELDIKVIRNDRSDAGRARPRWHALSVANVSKVNSRLGAHGALPHYGRPFGIPLLARAARTPADWSADIDSGSSYHI